MALEINSVIIGGNLTRDVVIKDTATGRRVCSFAVANNRTYCGNNGKVKETSFIDVEVWGAIAENCSRYLRKGSPVVVAGRLKQSRWETSGGEKRSRVKIVAANVQFLSSAKRQGAEPEPDEAADTASTADLQPRGVAGDDHADAGYPQTETMQDQYA